MRNEDDITRDPDEIEAFLRIIIRQRRWFITTLTLVLAIGVGWVTTSAPKYAMSFSYLVGTVPGDPEEMFVGEEILRESVQITSLDFAKNSRSISGAEYSFSADPDYTLGIVDQVLRFSMVTTEVRSEFVAEFEQVIIENLDRILEDRRIELLGVKTLAMGSVDSEIAALETAILKAPDSESLALRLGNAIANKSVIESHQLRLEKSVVGRLLDPPTRSRDTIGMSRGFKLILVSFVALMASLFVSILAEYTKRAMRPI
ncbi:MAG: hypothetical protein GY871_01745 [Actinomycetales bacterium]|nr:hypothetical protein [Actinomycetales bacterium]